MNVGRFEHALEDTGGTRWPTRGFITLRREDGERVGYVEYLLNRRETTALVRMIEVDSSLRRRGIGTTLVDELHRRHPRVRKLAFEEFLPAGRPFFKRYAERRR